MKEHLIGTRHKSIISNEVSAPCNYSSSEMTVKQKNNSQNNLSKTNFVYPLISVNNMHNNDTNLCAENNVLTTWDSMIYGINRYHFSKNFKSVKVRHFSGVTRDDMYFDLIPLSRKKSVALVLQMGISNSPNETLFQIYNKILNLVFLVCMYCI